MKNLIRLSIIFSLISIFLVRCANQGAPKGGPKDSLPPVVVRTTPKAYATNFNGKKIFIEFNEYVVLKDQQKLFFVSPPGTQKPKLTIKGRGIEVAFENSLDSATTYRLDFGSSIVDNNESNPLHGYSFVFSTGDVIDSLVMAGQVISAYERDSVVNAYLFYFDAKADSLQVDSTMFNGKVEALFRTDSSGYFIADILKDKKYRLYAMEDKNGDQKYQAGTDRIAFTDRTFNPTELESFTMTYDSIKRYMVIDPLQVKFELFEEIPVRRQLITKQERPHRQKILMTFNSLNPVIDSLQLGGIDPSWIIREDGLVGDSVTLWIAPPTKEKLAELQDTIRGTMVLQREDSVWNIYNSTEKLTFIHKIVQQGRRREQQSARPQSQESKPQLFKKRRQSQNQVADTTSQAKDSTENAKKDAKKPQNPFAFKTIADNPLNPEQHIAFEFEYPLNLMDSSRIELFHISNTEQRGRGAKIETKEIKMPFTMYNAPDNIRRWVLRAKWKSDEEYRLVIPSGVFRDITFEANDSLESKFKVANPEKFGSLVFNTPADTTDTSHYIFELIQGRGEKATIVRREKGVIPGSSVKFLYLKAGTYRLRVVQDSNANGKWDTGSLTHRRQPEKVRMVANDKNKEEFLSKENWEVKETINLQKLFE